MNEFDSLKNLNANVISMFFLIVFVIGTFSLLDLIFSDFQKNILQLNNWKSTEGVIFKVQDNDDVILTVRFMVEQLEWVIGEPIAFTYNSISGPFEGNKVTVWYNPNKPTEFALSASWLVKNRWTLAIGMGLVYSAISFYTFYEMIVTGFADSILNGF